jgi:hypothetical protein
VVCASYSTAGSSMNGCKLLLLPSFLYFGLTFISECIAVTFKKDRPYTISLFPSQEWMIDFCGPSIIPPRPKPISSKAYFKKLYCVCVERCSESCRYKFLFFKELLLRKSIIQDSYFFNLPITVQIQNMKNLFHRYIEHFLRCRCFVNGESIPCFKVCCMFCKMSNLQDNAHICPCPRPWVMNHFSFSPQLKQSFFIPCVLIWHDTESIINHSNSPFYTISFFDDEESE